MPSDVFLSKSSFNTSVTRLLSPTQVDLTFHAAANISDVSRRTFTADVPRFMAKAACSPKSACGFCLFCLLLCRLFHAGGGAAARGLLQKCRDRVAGIARHKARMARVERGDPQHLGVCGCEVENIEIFAHPLLVRRFDQRHDAALRQPAEYHLRRRLSVRISDLHERFVVEQVVLPRRQRRPRLHLDVLTSQIGKLVLTLEKRTALQKIHRGLDPVPEQEVRKPVLREVVHTDGADPARLIELFHRAPRAEAVVIGLVDDEEIEVVEPQTLHRRGKAALCALIADVGDPELRWAAFGCRYSVRFFRSVIVKYLFYTRDMNHSTVFGA